MYEVIITRSFAGARSEKYDSLEEAESCFDVWCDEIGEDSAFDKVRRVSLYHNEKCVKTCC